MKIFAKTTRGDAVEVDLAQLIARTPWLSGGKIAPPMPLSNEFLMSGSGRYDHWREIRWAPFELTLEQYETLKQQLVKCFGFTTLCHLEKCTSRVEWEAHQTTRQTGKPYEEILPLIAKLDVLDRAMKVIEGANEVEIEEAINLKRMDIISKLQS